VRARTVAVATTREKLVLSAVLALAFACRLDKLLETPRPPGLGVAPSRVAESAPAGSGVVRPGALMVSSSPSRVVAWTAHTESGAAWLFLADDSGSTPDTLRFTLNTAGLTPGTYRETIVVVPQDSTASTVRVPVELRIDPVAPSTGDLTATTSTTGSSLDPDGYTVAVDGGAPQAIAINSSTGITFTGLAAGNHTVVLGAVAANCTVNGGASRTVNVPSSGTGTAAYTVSCTTPTTTGDLTVTTSTTGSSLDPDGYTVAVDGGTPQSIAINNSTGLTFTGLAAGNHTVVLGGVAANCTVNGGASQTVNVPAGGTGTATYTVTCTTPPGNLTVSTNTTGSSLDPDGYTVTVDGGSAQSIGINASVDYPGLAAGNHTVAIAGVAPTCTVSGATSRTISVPPGGTATTTFTITCSTPPGTLTVSTNTTGSSLDPDGYTVTVDGGSAQSIGINASVDYPGLAAGNHAVAITGVASTCTVSGGTSRTVSVPSGGTATTTFTVTCTTPPPPTGDLTVTVSTTGGTPDPDGYTVTVDGAQSRGLGINESTTYAGIAAGSHSVQLNGLASNCTVSGSNPRSVNVPDGSSASTTFAVACPTPPPPTGDLTVGASTSGVLPDPDGYTVTVDGGQARGIGINGATTYTGIAAGAHTVELIGLALNCTVNGQNPRAVNVPAGSSASTTFAVDCPVLPPPPATNLAFTQQPPAAIVLSTPFSVTVTARDAQGGVATGFTGVVQLSLQGIGVGGLDGTAQVNAVGGIARFTNLRVTGLCVGCTLAASASGLTGATSSSFSVVLGQ